MKPTQCLSCLPSPAKRAAKAFTLIELLVVIAIIAILAAILFPVFAQARGKARQSSCLSNEKQIALALIQYQQDYDETLPLATTDIVPATNIYNISWVNAVQPYTKNLGIFVCPDAPYDALDGTPSQNPQDSGPVSNVFTTASRKNMGGPVVSYGMPPRLEVVNGVRTIANFTVSGATYGVPASIGAARYQGLGGYADPTGGGACGIGIVDFVIPSFANSDITRPAETILIADNNMWDGGGCGGFISQPRGRHVRERRITGGFPSGFANVAFMDGHVKAMKPEMMYAKTADPQGDFFTFFWPYK